jgi:hypothetical protein
MTVLDNDRDESSAGDAPVDDVATLHVHRAGGTDLDALALLLADATWLGEPVAGPGGEGAMVRYLTDLVLPLPPDGRLLSLRKAALVDIGPARVAEDGFDVEITWRSASIAPMFPVFAGVLRARRNGLTIEGRYAPPGGALGRAADRMLLHTAARATARWLLGHIAGQLHAPNLTPRR